MKNDDAFDTMSHLLTLAKLVFSAIRDDSPERVDEIMPGKLRLELAQAVARAKAKDKFK